MNDRKWISLLVATTVALSVLAAGSAPAPAATSTHPADSPAPERLAADTPRTTIQGTAFTAPAGWTITARGALVVLAAPEADSHLAIFDAPAGMGADAALAAAWAAYRPGFQRPLRLVTTLPARKGWDERRDHEYETSPSERVVVRAVARRHGDAWTVLIFDTSEPTFDRRSAAILLVDESLRPKGYVRESFAGRQAHRLTAERIKQMTDFVESALREAGVPGASLALIDGGKVVFEGGFGVKEMGKPARVDKDTLFSIGSNTKGMTTLLLAKLVDEGKLGWDTPVTQVYPGFKLGDAETTSKVLVKHLICACTGLPRQDIELIFQGAGLTPERVMNLLGTMQPTSKFGEIFQYSNVLAAAAGYVAGHVVHPDRDIGTAYDDAMREMVFGPLGMKTATFDICQMESGDHASPHSVDIQDRPALTRMELNSGIVAIRPAGGAWMSVHDMTKYLLLELSRGVLPSGERYISERNLLARRVPQVAMSKDISYGMGLMVDTRWGVPAVYHGGRIFGATSNWIIFPDQGVGAVLLTNSDSGGLLLGAFKRRLAEVIFDGRPEAMEDVLFNVKTQAAELAKMRERLVIPPDPGLVSKLAAHYVNDRIGDLTVKKQGAATIFDVNGIPLAVASRKNDDGTISFVTIEPGLIGEGAFVVGERSGGRALILRDSQHEYVFTVQ